MNTNDTISQETRLNSGERCLKFAGNKLARPLALVALLACFFAQGQSRADVLHPTAVSTDAGQSERVSIGYLTVYSSTEETQWGEGPYYYVHTGYRIYDSAGKAVKWIANHDATSTDEAPAKVELAPGRYTIWAQSDKGGYVRVPVIVRRAQTAAVNLET